MEKIDSIKSGKAPYMELFFWFSRMVEASAYSYPSSAGAHERK